MKSLDSIRWRRLRPLWFGVLLAAWAAPSSAQACATCFGASDDKMAQGMNMGIMALLAVVAVVLAGVLATGIVLVHRARRAQLLELSEEGSAGQGAPVTPTSQA